MYHFLIVLILFVGSLMLARWWFVFHISEVPASVSEYAQGVTSGLLVDVTNAEDIRGINTSGFVEGAAVASYAIGAYSLNVVLQNLPDPIDTDFYEGWVVRRGEDPSVVSTGKLVREGDEYVNKFISSRDLMNHDFYILTLEPDDGNPAPAYHIAEGELR